MYKQRRTKRQQVWLETLSRCEQLSELNGIQLANMANLFMANTEKNQK